MGWFDWLMRWAANAPAAPVGVVTATIPSENVVARFLCLKDFWSVSFQSQYVESGVYSLRVGNDKLAAKLPDWVEQGKVRII